MFVTTKMRVARPTDNLDEVTKFYRDGLGFAELSRFEDHDGFDGVMLGLPGAPYHLEFTKARGHRAGRAPTADNLLVFYLPDEGQWNDAVSRFKQIIGRRRSARAMSTRFGKFEMIRCTW